MFFIFFRVKEYGNCYERCAYFYIYIYIAILLLDILNVIERIED